MLFFSKAPFHFDRISHAQRSLTGSSGAQAFSSVSWDAPSCPDFWLTFPHQSRVYLVMCFIFLLRCKLLPESEILLWKRFSLSIALCFLHPSSAAITVFDWRNGIN